VKGISSKNIIFPKKRIIAINRIIEELIAIFLIRFLDDVFFPFSTG